MTLRQRLADTIETRGLLPAGAAVVVGVSGGPDSLCLLDVLAQLAPEYQWRLHVAHLDHGLRPDAPADAAFVRQQAAQRGLPFHTQRADTRAHAAAGRLSLEEAARELRYRFLFAAARDVGASHVAVAHTADDQAETVLLRLLRGAGLAGLSGMAWRLEVGSWTLEAGGWQLEERSEVGGQRSEGVEAPRGPREPISNQQSTISNPAPITLVRPLLGTSRAEVLAYCHQHNLSPRDDVTNRDPAFLRNRVRHELLPLLETYNPNIRAVLARTAEVLAGEHALAQQAVQAAWDAAVLRAPPEAPVVAFDRARWLALSPPAQHALLRRAVQRLRPSRREIDYTPLAAAARFSRTAAPGRVCNLLAGLWLTVRAEAVVVGEPEPGAEPPPNVPLLAADGTLADGWRLSVEAREPGQWAMQEVTGAGAPEGQAFRCCAYVDADRVPQPLVVRARRRGERFAPLGMGGHTVKVSDFMINAKVPAAWRARWPVVAAGPEGEALVWVAGLRVAEPYAVTPATRRVLRLSFTRAPLDVR